MIGQRKKGELGVCGRKKKSHGKKASGRAKEKGPQPWEELIEETGHATPEGSTRLAGVTYRGEIKKQDRRLDGEKRSAWLFKRRLAIKTKTNETKRVLSVRLSGGDSRRTPGVGSGRSGVQGQDGRNAEKA